MLVPHKCVSPNYLLKETFGPLRLLGATLMCIAQTILVNPLGYLANTLVCIAQNYFDKHHTGGGPPVGM